MHLAGALALLEPAGWAGTTPARWAAGSAPAAGAPAHTQDDEARQFIVHKANEAGIPLA